jgi:broad specificity phosphatase PhoE
MKTRLIIIRHGESEHNTKGICQGQIDSKLTDMGKRQAKALAHRLKDYEIDTMYSSPLQRARVTADIVKNNRDIEIITEKRIKEISCGYWEGIKVEKLSAMDPVEYSNWEERPHEFSVRDGETFQQVFDRASQALESIVRENEGKTVAIVAHLVSILLMIVHLENEQIKNIWKLGKQPNSALNILEIDDKGNVEFITKGDISHLALDDVAVPDWEPKQEQPAANIS